jgi:catalase
VRPSTASVDRLPKGGDDIGSDTSEPTTTDAGVPVPSDEHSLTVGPDGPILLQDHYLIGTLVRDVMDEAQAFN